MKARTILLTLAAVVTVACTQSPQERIKAYEQANQAMMDEYNMMMDSLYNDQAKAEAFYNDFVDRYVEFNL